MNNNEASDNKTSNVPCDAPVNSSSTDHHVTCPMCNTGQVHALAALYYKDHLETYIQVIILRAIRKEIKESHQNFKAMMDRLKPPKKPSRLKRVAQWLNRNFNLLK